LSSETQLIINEPDRPATRRFDGHFFHEWLVPLVEQWRSQRGLEPVEATVILTTIRGERFTVDGIRAAQTWIVVATETDEMFLLPIDEVASIVVKRRPEPAPAKIVGFTKVETIDSERSSRR
jgi:hypothetical protein